VEQKRLQAENLDLSRRLREKQTWDALRERVSKRLQQVTRLDGISGRPDELETLGKLKERLLRTLADGLEAGGASLATRGSRGSELVVLQSTGRGWRKTHADVDDSDLLKVVRGALAADPDDPAVVAVPLRVGSATVGALALARRDGGVSEAWRALLVHVARDAAVGIHNSCVFYEVRKEHARTEHELKLAQQIQSGLLPERVPQVPGLRLRTLTRGARRVSGDFYGFTRGYDGALGIYVGDVAGKGAPAALIMALSTNVFRELAKQLHEPGEVLTRANRTLTGYLGKGPSFVTAIQVLIRPQHQELCFARAGHEPPLLYRAGSGEVVRPEARGAVLGMFDNVQFDGSKLRLSAGDVLVLYTDGVIDAAAPNGERFGVQRLEQLIQRSAPGGAENVIQVYRDAHRRFVGKAPLRDDLTLVVVEVGFAGWEELAVPGTRDASNRAKAQLYEFMEGLGLDASTFQDLKFVVKEAFQDLKFVVKEAVNNALEHGNRWDHNKRLRLSWRADADALRIKVGDAGQGFDPSVLPDPTAPEHVFRPRGRGVYMMRRILDELHFSDLGNEVELVKRLRPCP
jgi:serine phosphatase RsbU (regulator of sigma subunit)/anti-sigma regulatory factor (Ser/Thr protein kinase)